MASKKTSKQSISSNEDLIKKATKDVAWEQVCLLAAAVEMTKGSWEGHASPLNHLVQQAFLIHVRNLIDFFRGGGPKDRISAKDFCLPSWNPAREKTGALTIAINQTIMHLSFARDRSYNGHRHFEGWEHAHGTVAIMLRLWTAFKSSIRPEFLRPQCPEDIDYWLDKHTNDWRVNYTDMLNAFTRGVEVLPHWQLNKTPDGPISKATT